MNTVFRWIKLLLGAPGSLPAPRHSFGPQVVTGYVDLHGAGGFRPGPDQPWLLRFRLEPWRRARGGVQPRGLAVTRTCTDAELEALRARLHPYQPVAARVDLKDWVTAELLELLDTPVDDPRLAARADGLRARPTRQDARFGTLTRTAPGTYEAAVPWNGSDVVLELEGEDEDLDAALAAARALWDDEAGWQRRVQDHAVGELLELKNENWPDDDDAQPLTPDEFRARMRLQAITVDPDGGFEFFHAHGDLFWDHVVQVGGTLHEGVTHSAVEG